MISRMRRFFRKLMCKHDVYIITNSGSGYAIKACRKCGMVKVINNG